MPQAIDCVQKRDAGGNVTNVNAARKRPSDYRPDWTALVLESQRGAAEGRQHSRLQLACDDPRVKANEDAGTRLQERKDALAEEIWATKACDSADVLLLAEITWDRLWGVAGIAKFPDLPVHIDSAVPDPEAVAPLIRGIVDAAQAQADRNIWRGDVESELLRLHGTLKALNLLAGHAFSGAGYENDALGSLLETAEEQAHRVWEALYPGQRSRLDDDESVQRGGQ